MNNLTIEETQSTNGGVSPGFLVALGPLILSQIPYIIK
ncbi:hypothetical protein HNQ88_005171 [Aureibacter tunicatorum]|uniref:Uncharacterized protein n=1 Tax=Aureibacter tunicatorum TaxID=866807 RepID=A0AAE3XUA2_9BACT|nr:hypothetical protein [Aureibacter tunicatorum]BDD07563.1 hypothetical protein AUTU_50460 [Aureibacter tunicatorum]